MSNDISTQAMAHEPGFGGVGGSGTGRYGGYVGFKNFSNPKGVIVKKESNFWPITDLSPPWTEGKMRTMSVVATLHKYRQNAFFYRALTTVAIVVAYLYLSGDSGIKRNVASWLIGVLEPHAGKN